MVKLLSNLHIFIFLFAAWQVWEKYDRHVEEMTSLQDQLPVVQNNIRRIDKQLKALKEYYKDIDKAKDRIEKVAQKVEAIQKQFPDQISDPENLHLFSELAKGINIKDVYLAPDREDIHGFYITKEYSFKASATYLQFLVFLEYLEKQEKLFNIKSIEFNQSEAKQRGRFQLINGEIKILAYRHNKAYKEDRGYDQIEAEIKEMEKKKVETKKKKPKKKK